MKAPLRLPALPSPPNGAPLSTEKSMQPPPNSNYFHGQPLCQPTTLPQDHGTTMRAGTTTMNRTSVGLTMLALGMLLLLALMR